MTRREVVSDKRQTLAARALGGIRVAARAEQLRACGVDTERAAALLGIAP